MTFEPGLIDRDAVRDAGALQSLLVYGNCQASWFAHMLKADSEIGPRFDIQYFPNYGDYDPAHPALSPDFWRRNPIFLRQTAPDSPPLPFEPFIPSACRQFRYPTMWGKFLWPFTVFDPQPAAEEGLPWGRFPYGDRLVIQWLQAGADPSEIPGRYYHEDLAKHIDLDRYLKICFAEMAFTDRQSDVSMAPFIEKEYRCRPLFKTSRHPAFVTLNFLLNRIRAWILETAVPEPPAYPMNGIDLGDEEIPLHPQIISKLQLEWPWPEMRYHFRSRMLTFHEYFAAYSRFELIPPGSMPELWLARADQAFRMGRPEEAQRLLFAGVAAFPGTFALYQPLAALLTQAGRFTEAGGFLYCALAFPGLTCSDEAQLYNNLGIIQFRQGDLGKAEASFQAAIRLQPEWQEAADNLRELQAYTQSEAASA